MSQDYIQKIKSVSGLEIKDIYHTQDSMVCFDLGEEMSHTLTLDGWWEVYKNSQLILSSELKTGKSDHQYYQGIRDGVEILKNNVTKIISIDFSEDLSSATITLDNDHLIKITKSEFGLLTLKDNKSGEYFLTPEK